MSEMMSEQAIREWLNDIEKNIEENRKIGNYTAVTIDEIMANTLRVVLRENVI
jgi:hypothetical protein